MGGAVAGCAVAVVLLPVVVVSVVAVVDVAVVSVVELAVVVLLPDSDRVQAMQSSIASAAGTNLFKISVLLRSRRECYYEGVRRFASDRTGEPPRAVAAASEASDQ